MMNRRSLALLASLSLSLFACVGTASAPEDQKVSTAAALKESNAAKQGTAKQVEVDGGLDGTQRPTHVVLRIDDETCTLDPTTDTIGLDRGLDGNGWSAQIYVEKGCAGGFILDIDGVDDAPYPQTKTIPFLAEEGAILFTNASENGEDVDAGAAAGGVYRASNAGGALTVTSGPSKDTTSFAIQGQATVVSDAYPDHVRTVTFALEF